MKEREFKELEDKVIYLAIPYTGQERHSFSECNKISAILMDRGALVFSPISMSHPVVEAAKNIGINSLDGNWEIWEKQDIYFLSKCNEMYVYANDTDKVIESIGVMAEIKKAVEFGIPITFIRLNVNGQLSRVRHDVDKLIMLAEALRPEEIKLSINSKWNYIAKQKSGNIYAFEHQPVLDGNLNWSLSHRLKDYTMIQLNQILSDEILEMLSSIDYRKCIYKINHI